MSKQTLTEFYRHVAGLVRSARERKGLTTLQLAQAVDVPETTVERLEAGTLTTNGYFMERVAAALGVEPKAIYPDWPLEGD